LAKSVLVVAHDPPLNASRVSLLRGAGYLVDSVESDDDAMAILELKEFDLILLGRRSMLPKKGIDQRIREKYPLKIERKGEDVSTYPTKVTDPEPEQVLAALAEMLGEDLRLASLE
jgi:hypothetical protein